MSDEIRATNIPEAQHVTQSAPKRLTCSYCGSEDITKELTLGLSKHIDQVGVQFETGKFLGIGLPGTEPLRATICNVCGTVVRLWVKNVERKWA